MAIISIDLGTKKTGMAISKDPYIVAEDLPIIFESREDKLIGIIKEIILKENVDKIVIGVPLNIKGDDTKGSIDNRRIGERLKRALGEDYQCETIYIDEAMSSIRAGEYLKKKNGQTSKLDDSISAKILLQEYLNNI